MKRIISLILVLVMALFCVSCSSAPKTYKYSQLSSDRQEVVDYIYQSKGIWDNSDAGKISFSESEGKRIMSVFILCDRRSDSYSGWTIQYAYDVENQTFDIDNKTYVNNHHAPSYSSEISHSWDETAYKDYIANKYAQKYNNK